MKMVTVIKPNVVIIAAAKVGGIYANYKYPYNFISENLRIEQNLIEAAWLNKAKRLLFLGSSCIYPKNSKVPIKEEELLTAPLEITKICLIAKYDGEIIWDHDKPDGTFKKNLEISRIKSIGWAPKISLTNGLEQVIKNIDDSLNDNSDKGKNLKNFL